MHLPIFKFKVQPLNMSSYIYQILHTLIVQKQWHSKFKLGNLGACGVWIEPQIYKELNPLQHTICRNIYPEKHTNASTSPTWKLVTILLAIKTQCPLQEIMVYFFSIQAKILQHNLFFHMYLNYLWFSIRI